MADRLIERSRQANLCVNRSLQKEEDAQRRDLPVKMKYGKLEFLKYLVETVN